MYQPSWPTGCPWKEGGLNWKFSWKADNFQIYNIPIKPLRDAAPKTNPFNQNVFRLFRSVSVSTFRSSHRPKCLLHITQQWLQVMNAHPFFYQPWKRYPFCSELASLSLKAITGRTLPPRVRLKLRVLTQGQWRDEDKALLSPKIK